MPAAKGEHHRRYHHPGGSGAQERNAHGPIVMLPLGDPVGTGLVESLARPGRNVTGLSFMADGIAAKRLELLKEAVPNSTRVLVLSYLVDPIATPQIRELEKAGRALRVEVLLHDIRMAADLPGAFEAGAKEHADALLTTAESIFTVQRKRVVELAAQYKLPGMYAVSSSSRRAA